MSRCKGVRVFFGGDLHFKGSFSTRRGSSEVSGCAQGPGAGQTVLVSLNPLRLLAIRAAAGRGMLLLAQRSWQPGGIAGKQSGHLTSRVLPL